MSEFERPRRRLIESLREQGIRDLAVLHAFDVVPRHLFVPEALRHQAYRDAALPIGLGQTISRPLTHALGLQALRLTGRERVLEVGAGSGFQTALLARLGHRVYALERIPELARRAREALARLGLRNVTLRLGDGSRGWREGEAAPFDAVVVAAHAEAVPEPLLEQLAPAGRLLIPLGPPEDQRLTLVRRDRAGRVRRSVIGGARFVPLVPEAPHGD